MPRNRRPRDREEKRAEIVDAARELFLAVGFDNVSITQIAAAAGVTSTTIYWYFSGKDELLVAVLDGVLTTSLGRFDELADTDPTDRIVWVVDELRSMSTLVDTVHTRRLSSTLIDDWHTRFHTLADELTRAMLPPGLTPDVVQAQCRIATFVIEGLLTHPLDFDETRAVARSLAATIGATGRASEQSR
ncbi:TetR/AcrR family transcriptional regulator [Gordonia sp. 'Campus']|uniref:TetR/AcrR family transcriptional regulator n=1 Tax=Gordonia sp. 'Campus' TaxID=2915824 RepID=UPI001EE3B66B|nr:TetR/AcrR family transcriptional regulator [Gordonia sp. 'Campus']